MFTELRLQIEKGIGRTIMIECVLIVIIVLSGVLFLTGLIMGVYQHIHTKDIPISQLSIPKTTYTQLVIDYCHTNLNTGKTKKPVGVVKYNKNKTTHGVYYPSSNQIVVYVNTHTHLKELTNTIIHEYVHSTQKNRTFNSMYDHYNQSVGYQNNPFEIESRKVSEQYDNQCVKYLVDRYQILQIG